MKPCYKDDGWGATYSRPYALFLIKLMEFKMKKLLLTAAAVAVLSSSAIAEDGAFYLRGDVGGNMFTKQKVNGNKLKSKTFASLDVGVGYYAMDNVRAELVFSHQFSPEYKARAGSVKAKSTIEALLVKGAVDVYDFGAGKVFLDAGVGLAQVKTKVTSATGAVTTYKKKNNAAFTVGGGVGFGVADGVNLDLQYAFSGYGKAKNGKVSHNANSIKAGVRFDI